MVAAVGGGLLILAFAMGYLVPATVEFAGPLSSASGPVAVAIPSQPTFLSTLPVTISWSGLTGTQGLVMAPCPASLSASACLRERPLGYAEASSPAGRITLEVPPGDSLGLSTNASGNSALTVSVSAPLWATSTLTVSLLTAAGVVLVAVGAARRHARRTAHAPPLSKCPACGNPTPTAVARCPRCGHSIRGA